MKHKLSIYDIAKELNVSSTTVSFVINGKAREKRISVEMEERIKHYVAKVGYLPNMMAKSLRTGKSKIIGLMVENICDPFFSSIARVIEEKTYNLGYKIFHSSTDNSSFNSKSLINVFRERRVDGCIIAPAPGIEQDIQRLVDNGIPVVQFDRYYADLNTDVVIVDNEDGVRTAVKHLSDSGYHNIGFVTLESFQVQMADRLNGYLCATREKDGRQFVLQIPYGTEPAFASKKIKQFIAVNPSMDAIIFATNYLAISGLVAIKELNVHVPSQMGIVGFDDNTHFSLFSPSITAIAQPVRQISETVIKMMIACLEEKEGFHQKRQTVILKTTLNIRESSLRYSQSIRKPPDTQHSISFSNQLIQSQ